MVTKTEAPLPRTHGVEWAEVTGRDQAENERHGIARIAFLNALFPDACVHALWERWMTRSGAREAAREIRELFNSAGATAHRRGRRGTAVSHADVPLALNAAMDRLERAWPADDLSYMAEALTFVRETLKLPWPWVAGELAAEWQIHIWTAAFGRQHWHQRLTLSPPMAPAMSFSFTPRADETAPAAIARLVPELRCYLQEISEPAPQRRRVTRDGVHIAEWPRGFTDAG